jgi:hypothetical protein
MASQPLDSGIAGDYGERLGVDLSDVQIHTGDEAHARNGELGARAFAEGSDIHFADGEYEEGSDEGQELLAHEIVHVAQTKKDGASGGAMTKRADGASVGDHEQEADRGAQALVHGSGPVEVEAAPAPIMRKEDAAPKAPDLSTKLSLIAHQLRQAVSELDSDKEHATEDGARAAATLQIAATDLGMHLPAFQALSEAKRAPLRQSMEQIGQAAGQLHGKGAGTDGAFYFLHNIVVSYFPDVSCDAPAAVQAKKAAAKDNVPLIQKALDEVESELKEADESDQHEGDDLMGPCGIESLGAVHGLLREGIPDQKLETLKPRIEKIAGHAARVANHKPNGARTKDLLARMYDVCNDVGATAVPLNVSKNGPTEALIKDEREKAKLGNFTKEQAEQFDKAKDSLYGAFDFIFATQMAGVEAVRDQADEKDPPPKGNFWLDLAVNAITVAATTFLPVVGQFVMKKLGGAATQEAKAVINAATSGAQQTAQMFTKAEIQTMTKETVEVMNAEKENIRHVAVEKAEDFGKESGRKAYERVNEAMNEKEAPKGSGDSGYFKTDFFDAQRKAVVLMGAKAKISAIEKVGAMRGQLESNPKAAIEGLEKMGSLRGDPEVFDTIETTQKTRSRAQYLAAIAHNAQEAHVEEEKKEHEAVEKATGRHYDWKDPTKTAEGKEENEQVEREGKEKGVEATNMRGMVDVKTANFGNAHAAKYDSKFDGVVSIVFEGDVKYPHIPVKVKSASLTGVNEGMRKDVASMKLKDVGIPFRAMSAPGMFDGDGVVSLARNETGHIFVESSGKGDQWLLARDKTKEDAARDILESDIGNYPLKDIDG